jgi:hypothetical protein
LVKAQNKDQTFKDGRLRNAYASEELIDPQAGTTPMPGAYDRKSQAYLEDENAVIWLVVRGRALLSATQLYSGSIPREGAHRPRYALHIRRDFARYGSWQRFGRPQDRRPCGKCLKHHKAFFQTVAFLAQSGEGKQMRCTVGKIEPALAARSSFCASARRFLAPLTMPSNSARAGGSRLSCQS